MILFYQTRLNQLGFGTLELCLQTKPRRENNSLTDKLQKQGGICLTGAKSNLKSRQAAMMMIGRGGTRSNKDFKYKDLLPRGENTKFKIIDF